MDHTTEIITKSSHETAQFGEKLASGLKWGSQDPVSGLPHVLCLYGDLGSGKTTFVQGFARGLGITDRLLSPTFLIVRRHNLPSEQGFLYHLDLYRIESSRELEEIGLYDMVTDQSSYVLIEWAEKLGNSLPKERVDLHFEVIEDNVHKITVKQISNDPD